MDRQAITRMAANGGVIGAGEVEALGCSPEDREAWVRRGLLVRVRRGAFVDGDLWSQAGVDERYRLTVMAVARARGGSEVATRSGLRVTPLRGLVAREPVEGLQVQAVADALVTTASFSVEAAVVAAD